MNEPAKASVNQNMPSDEAIERLIRFMLKTSVPRIIAKRRAAEKVNKEGLNGSINS